MKIQGILVLAMLAAGMPVAMAQTSPADNGTSLTYTQPVPPQGKRLVQQRLTKLGYSTGGTGGSWGPESAAALNKFQQTHGLQATGQLNEATVKTLNLNLDQLLGFQNSAGQNLNNFGQNVKHGLENSVQ